MSADGGRLEDIRDYIVKKGLDEWNLFLGVKDTGGGLVALWESGGRKEQRS